MQNMHKTGRFIHVLHRKMFLFSSSSLSGAGTLLATLLPQTIHYTKSLWISMNTDSMVSPLFTTSC